MTCHWGNPDLYVYKKKNIQYCRNSSRIQHKFVERDKINTLNMSAHFSCFFLLKLQYKRTRLSQLYRPKLPFLVKNEVKQVRSTYKLYVNPHIWGGKERDYKDYKSLAMYYLYYVIYRPSLVFDI